MIKGEVIYYYNDEIVYKDKWKKDKIEGKRSYINPNDSKYIGQYKE